MKNNEYTYQFTAPMTGYAFCTQPLSYKETQVSSEKLIPYKELIDKRIRESLTTPTEKESGLAEYLPKNLKEKVLSVFPSTRILSTNGQKTLESVMTVQTTSPLYPRETKQLLEFIERQYSSGWSSSISNREIAMTDDSILHVSFMVPSTDRFAVTQSPELDSAYEYEILSPVTFQYFPESEYTSDFIPLAGDEVPMEEEFIGTLKNLVATRGTPREELHGLAPYFSFEGAEKILSTKPYLEIISSQYEEKLICKTIVKTDSPLEGTEIESLKEELSAQFSDGWGEWLEQQPIRTAEGEYYLHTGSLTDAAFQLEDRLVKEPEQCIETQDYPFEPSY